MSKPVAEINTYLALSDAEYLERYGVTREAARADAIARFEYALAITTPIAQASADIQDYLAELAAAGGDTIRRGDARLGRSGGAMVALDAAAQHRIRDVMGARAMLPNVGSDREDYSGQYGCSPNVSGASRRINRAFFGGLMGMHEALPTLITGRHRLGGRYQTDYDRDADVASQKAIEWASKALRVIYFFPVVAAWLPEFEAPTAPKPFHIEPNPNRVDFDYRYFLGWRSV